MGTYWYQRLAAELSSAPSCGEDSIAGAAAPQSPASVVAPSELGNSDGDSRAHGEKVSPEEPHLPTDQEAGDR